MATKGLAVLNLEINDQVIEYKPNSLDFKDGFGDMKVRHQTGGGAAGSKVITEDAETQIGMVKFTLYTEVTNTERKNSWLELSRSAQGNVIRLSGEGFTRNFRRMRITTEPRPGVGAEGEFEVEFEGDPAA